MLEEGFLLSTLTHIDSIKNMFIKYEDEKKKYDNAKNKKELVKPVKPKFTKCESDNLNRIKEYISYHIRHGNVSEDNMELANRILRSNIETKGDKQ